MAAGVVGEGKYAFGPGRLFRDGISGGANDDMGPTDGITWEWALTWLGLRSADAGDRDDEMAVSASDWILTAGLAKPTWETLLMVHPAIEGEYNSAGDLIGVHGFQARGHNTEDHRFLLTFKEYDRSTSAITTNPWRIVDFWSVAAIPEKISLQFDAKTQRYFPVRLQAKESVNHLTPVGRYAAWRIRGGLAA